MKKLMKKCVPALMAGSVLLSSTCAFASPLQTIQDRIGTDKIAHAGVGYFVSDVLDRTTKLTPLERLGVVMGLEVAKESTDAEWSNKDVAATALGALAQIGISQLQVHGKF